MTESFTPPDGFSPDPLFFGRGRVRSRKQAKRLERRRRHAQFVPFTQLPPREQRDLTVRLGWKIRNDLDSGGQFVTHHLLPGCREWAHLPETPITHYADVFFLAQGRAPRVYFNATVHTLAARWAQALIEAVEADVEAQLSPEDQRRAFPRVYTRPSSMGHELLFAPPATLASLGGLTLDGARAARLRDIWETRADRLTIGESATLDPGYRSGVGLDLVVVEPNLTIAAVNRAIERFRSWGECDHVGPPEPFQPHQAAVDALLRRELWHWDASQARAEGREPPPFPDEAEATDGFYSNAIRVP